MRRAVLRSLGRRGRRERLRVSGRPLVPTVSDADPDCAVIAGVRSEIIDLTRPTVRAGLGDDAVQVDHAVATTLLSSCPDVGSLVPDAGPQGPKRIGDLYRDLALRLVAARRESDVPLTARRARSLVECAHGESIDG